jgi:hypothetical protein
VQRDHSVFTMAALSGAGGVPAAVTDGGGAADARRASTRRYVWRPWRRTAGRVGRRSG